MPQDEWIMLVPASSFKVLDQVLLREADVDANASAPSCGFQQDWVPHLHPPTHLCECV